MKKQIVALLCLANFAGLAAPDFSVSVGGTDVAIPVPAGFAPVVPEMKTLNKMLDAASYGENERLGHLIPEGEATLALANEIPEMARSFSIQTPKKDRTLTKKDFQNLAMEMVKQNLQLIAKLDKEMPGYLEKVNTKMKAALDADMKFQNLTLAPLPPHQQEERALAYSMFMTMQSAGGPIRIAGTTTILYVKAKLLFLYAYAPEKELAWTREISRQWAADILSKNPSSPELAKMEEHGPSGWRGPQSTILRNALIGAIIGGLIGALRGFSRKKKNSKVAGANPPNQP